MKNCFLLRGSYCFVVALGSGVGGGSSVRSSLPFGQWDDLPESSAQNPKIQSPSVGFKSDFAETLTTQVTKLKRCLFCDWIARGNTSFFQFFSWFGLFSGLHRGCTCDESEAPAIATAFRRAGLNLNLATDAAIELRIFGYIWIYRKAYRRYWDIKVVYLELATRWFSFPRLRLPMLHRRPVACVMRCWDTTQIWVWKHWYAWYTTPWDL